jgi:hypothetical protein
MAVDGSRRAGVGCGGTPMPALAQAPQIHSHDSLPYVKLGQSTYQLTWLDEFKTTILQTGQQIATPSIPIR